MTTAGSANDGVDTEKGNLPKNVQRIINGVENGSLTGITAQEFIQVFQAISANFAGHQDTVKRIAEMAGQSQKDAQANIKAAISGDSETLAHVAKNLETDQARLEFTRLFMEREREKTKQAKTAAKANDSNNKLFATLATITGAVLLGGVKLLADRRA